MYFFAAIVQEDIGAANGNKDGSHENDATTNGQADAEQTMSLLAPGVSDRVRDGQSHAPELVEGESSLYAELARMRLVSSLSPDQPIFSIMMMVMIIVGPCNHILDPMLPACLKGYIACLSCNQICGHGKSELVQVDLEHNSPLIDLCMKFNGLDR